MKKTMRSGTDRFISVYPTRTNNSYGRFLGFHNPCLHTAGMGSQQPVRIFIYIKCILHVPGGMIFRQIEGGKIMPVIFNLRTFGHRKSESPKNFNDAVSDKTDWMPGARWHIVSRQR